MGRFLSLFGKERIRFLTADREFIGADWIEWLRDNQVPFRIRIKKAGEQLIGHEGKVKTAREWFAGEASSCRSKPMLLWCQPVYLGGAPARRGWRHLQSLLACLSGRPNEGQFYDAIRRLKPVKL